MPADFFRTMEDASGVDLDWFWRGWFYSTDHVDIAVNNIRQLNVDTQDPEVEKSIRREKRDSQPVTNSERLNQSLSKRVEKYPDLKDFYNDFDELDVTPQDRRDYKQFLDGLTEEERSQLVEKRNFYLLEFQNVGGLVMPVIFDVEFEDGSTQHVRIPAEIWKRDNERVTKLLITEKLIKSLTLDPRLETADIDLENNHFPRRIAKSRFQLFKDSRAKNPMQRAQEPDDGKKLDDN